MDRLDDLLAEFFDPTTLAPAGLGARIARHRAGADDVAADVTRFPSLIRCSCAHPRRQTIRVVDEPTSAGVFRSSSSSAVFIGAPKA